MYKISILIVIVLYKRNIQNSCSYNCIKKQLTDEFLYIYDNSPSLNSSTVDYENSIIIRDESNSGLSIAYNKAAEYAKNNGFNWIILLDQDTILPENFLCEYKKSIEKNKKINIFCPQIKLENTNYYISPGKIKLKTIRSKGVKISGERSLKKFSAINSGLLINTDAFLDAGGYDENVYLDFSDFQFFERFSKKNSILGVVNITLVQNLSNFEKNKDKLYARFIIYCNCAFRCSKKNFIDKIEYGILIFGRAIKLFNRTKQIRFIECAIKNYYLGRNI